MSDDLLAKMKAVDPATDERVATESRSLGDLPGRIAAGESPVAGRVHRFPRVPRRAIALGLAAALLTIGVAVPLALLRPLGGGGVTYGDVGDGWFRAGSLETLQANQVTYLPEVKIFVVASRNAQPYALDAAIRPTAANDGTAALYCTSSRSFFVPGRSAQFDLGGVPYLGTRGAMSGVPVRATESFVDVDTAAAHRLHAAVAAQTSPPSDTPCDEGNGYREVRPGIVEPIPATGLAPIEVSFPHPGDVVTSPVTISGTADVAEGNVRFQIKDANGTILVDDFTTATCGTGCRGDYSAEVPFDVTQEQDGTILVFEESLEDGSKINVVKIPVTLQPPAPIEVSSPASGQVVTSPVTVSGTADVFEAVVSIRIIVEGDLLVADTTTLATCGSGCRGKFSAKVSFPDIGTKSAVIQVFERSAKDGAMINVVEIPVTVTPDVATPGRPIDFAGTWIDFSSGNPVPANVLTATLGPEHCSWDDIVFLDLDIPDGPKGSFLRDVKGELSGSTAQPFQVVTALPDDAVDTGYFKVKWFLWTSASDPDAVYVVNGVYDPSAQGLIERWPAITQQFGCA
jgi:hypothetical protein